MGNVIEFPTAPSEEVLSKEQDFLQNYLMPWAEKNGLDISSMKFKLNGTTILTCIQGMLLDGI